MCTVPTFQDSSCSSLGAGQPAGRTDRETRVGCSMDSWCELSESCKWVHWVYCEVYCLSKHEGVTDTPSFYWVCVSGGCSLGSMGGWRSHGICIREAPPCTAVTPPATVKILTALTNRESSLSHPHPQRTAGTLQGVPPSCCGCRAAVWSGVRSFEPIIKGRRHDAQAACEPDGEECGGVPVHPARQHTHRTSPAKRC
jgi:hypothetical protein